MTADSIMTEALVTVTPDATVADALRLMTRHRVHNIPVVDEQGLLIGLFSLRRLAHELLPAAARLNADSFHMDIGFLQDNSDKYLQRLQILGQKTVSELLEKKKKLRFCEPDTPIPRLLQLLSENPTSLPVLIVEGRQHRLVGMVSTWDVLTKIYAVILPDQDAAPSVEEKQSEH